MVAGLITITNLFQAVSTYLTLANYIIATPNPPGRRVQFEDLSHFKKCYRHWPRSRVLRCSLAMIIRFQKAQASEAEFITALPLKVRKRTSSRQIVLRQARG